MFLQNSDIIW